MCVKSTILKNVKNNTFFKYILKKFLGGFLPTYYSSISPNSKKVMFFKNLKVILIWNCFNFFSQTILAIL